MIPFIFCYLLPIEFPFKSILEFPFEGRFFHSISFCLLRNLNSTEYKFIWKFVFSPNMSLQAIFLDIDEWRELHFINYIYKYVNFCIIGASGWEIVWMRGLKDFFNARVVEVGNCLIFMVRGLNLIYLYKSLISSFLISCTTYFSPFPPPLRYQSWNHIIYHLLCLPSHCHSFSLI